MVKVSMKDTGGHVYSSDYFTCNATSNTGGNAEIDLKYKDTAGTIYQYKLKATGEFYDLSSTYTWDGSYTDPTTCDTETQKSLVDDEFYSQERRCLLNGFLCTWDSS